MKKRRRKYLFVTIICFCISILFYKSVFDEGLRTSASNLNKSDEKVGILSGKVIVLDPGHGEHDGGTTGLIYGTIEKDLNLLVAKNIKRELEDKTAATVILTRNDDSNPGINQRDSLEKRIKLAETQKADLFISIHHDAFEDRSVNGITVHYGNHQSENKVLATLVQTAIFNQPIVAKDRVVKESEFYVLNNSNIPSILLELGFTSNEEDEKRMNSEEFQLNSSKGIAEGIVEYFLS